MRNRNIIKELIDPDPARFGLDRFGQIKKKLEKYQTEKKALPEDSDGVYLIVKGIARIENKHDQYDFGGQKVRTDDYFGISKYILCQGYSYFGDIIAAAKSS